MSDWPELKEIFNAAAVEDIARRLARAAPRFNRRAFTAEIMAVLPSLELKARSRCIANAMRAHLPGDFPQVLSILLTAMGPDDGAGGVEGMSGFRFMPFLDVLGLHGVEHYEESLAAMEIMTRYFSAEFAIRPFLLRHPKATLARARQWARDADWRVRRLASEGLRPRLPWGERIPAFVADPAPVIAILDRLIDDPHANVRNSVANNLNDIAKDHPALAVATAARWSASGDESAVWIAKRGLRSLIKAGDPAALKTCGFDPCASCVITGFKLKPSRARIGGSIAFSFDLRLRAKTSARVAIDYVLARPLAGGTSAEKVFKLAVKTMPPNRAVTFQARLALKQLSTRRYYPGHYAITVVANGRRLARKAFTVSG